MRRLLVIVALLALAGCSDDDGEVPEDQAIRPAAPPDGWAVDEVGPVTVATPPEWEAQGTEQLADNVTSSIWEQPATTPGEPPLAAIDIRVVDHPQQSAEDASIAQGADAMARVGADAPDPVPIVWPGATEAYLQTLETELTGSAGTSAPYDAWIVVYDLSDDLQIQVTAMTAGSEDPAVPEQVLSSIAFGTEDSEA